MIPFFSREAEDRLVEQIGSMERSGVCLGYDAVSASAAYVLVKVEHGQLPVMHRWTVEGPVTLEHASLMIEEIAAAAEIDGLTQVPDGGMSIN